MMRADVIFVPSPGVGHLISTVEFAKLLVNRDKRIFISILIIKLPFDSGISSVTQNLKQDAPEGITFVDVPPLDETLVTELMSLSRPKFFSMFIESQKAKVKDAVEIILDRSEPSYKLVGFVIDMFCTPMIDVANEFNVPSYAFFTSGAAFLGFMFYSQSLKDNENREIYEYKDSDVELVVPSYGSPVPAKVLPLIMLKEDGSALIIKNARRLREAKGILVNTVLELEAHAIKSLKDTSHVYHVGPIIKLAKTDQNQKSDEAIISWLDSQPPSSVVYLCFGSMGTFDLDQVMEIARALELSGQRFLWSLRQAPHQAKVSMALPKDYEDYSEVLPEGFLERTSGIGKVIGWAPQVTILSHPSVGGFVSHCGWNSTLESVWCGVPIAAWPIHSEQQLNAFQLVKELGIAVEIKMDYKKDHGGSAQLVTAEEIEKGIKCLMVEENEVRKRMKEMKDMCRRATTEGGSSYTSLGQFIENLMGYE